MDRKLLEHLEDLIHEDTDTRAKLLAEDRLHGRYEQEMQDVHRENAYALDQIISNHGWPGISRVGLDGSRAAWLIAQHAICTPELQRNFLRHLSKAADVGDVPMSQVALLTDRIRFNEGKPQVYGTVLDWDENGELTCEVDSPEEANQRREEVGLPPFEQALQEHRKEVEAEGGQAPKNHEAYRQKVAEWAKSVGWR